MVPAGKTIAYPVTFSGSPERYEATLNLSIDGGAASHSVNLFGTIAGPVSGGDANPPVTVDNSDPGFAIEIGSPYWETVNGAGRDNDYVRADNTYYSYVQWTIAVPSAGEYEFYSTWGPDNAGDAGNTPYQQYPNTQFAQYIVYDTDAPPVLNTSVVPAAGPVDGDINVIKNQRNLPDDLLAGSGGDGTDWELLGTASIESDTVVVRLITNETINGGFPWATTIADAIRVVHIGSANSGAPENLTLETAPAMPASAEVVNEGRVIDFGYSPLDQSKTFTLRNDTNRAIPLRPIPQPSPSFIVTANITADEVLRPGESKSITIQYVAAEGVHEATLEIPFGDGDSLEYDLRAFSPDSSPLVVTIDDSLTIQTPTSNVFETTGSWTERRIEQHCKCRFGSNRFVRIQESSARHLRYRDQFPR